ncbi:MAG: pyridoxal-phosphate dependent enzyme, partial [Bdellovibrionales bacterium]|nr:pyridoxal-phosphate dependent enzyme [Bdellovibrionales bacterium]
KALRNSFPYIRIYAVEPNDSAVLSGDTPGFHKIEGNGAGFVPPILDTSIYDGVVRVRNDDAIEMCRRLAREEGLLVGISSGSAIWASLLIAQDLGKGNNLVTVAPDRGDRYLDVIYEGTSIAEDPISECHD